jgi:ubiquinone/menaquinone biosynthesis C-methylase UbiE
MGHFAPIYDLLNKFLFSLFLTRERTVREMTLELAQVRAGERVLEVGCGTGSLTLAASKRVGASGEVHGIDAAPEMIAAARRKFERAGADADLQVGRIDEIPFSDGRFDVVLASFMIFHMAEDTRRRGLPETRRVLKPGGRLLIVDFEPPKKGYLRIVTKVVLGHLLGGEEMLRHSVHELRPLMEEAGFAGVETGGTRFKVIGFARGTSLFVPTHGDLE